MSVVHVPVPCPEKVEAMQKSGSGFYCESCAHVVIDFTQKSDNEILAFLTERTGQRTCGYFRNDQLKRRSDWPFEMVRFVAALALTFGSFLFITSCVTTGESEVKRKEDSTKAADSIANIQVHTTGVVLCEPEMLQDTSRSESKTLGWVTPEINDTLK